MATNERCKKRDKAAFETLWVDCIEPAMRNAIKDCDFEAYVRHGAKRDVWTIYSVLNLYSSESYMTSENELMNRFMVAACYMCAILTASPLAIVGDDSGIAYGQTLLNERLAIKAGCDILNSFLLEACRAAGDDGLKDAIRKRGVTCNRSTGRTSYQESVLDCLYYTRHEQSYNILMLALLLFHWEKDSFTEEDYRKIIDYYRKTLG